MAYELTNPVKRIGGYGGTTLWQYVDGDAAASIDASGYFNLAAAKLKVGDFIFAVANGVPALFYVSANTRDITATPPVSGVVDVNNNTLAAAVDSD